MLNQDNFSQPLVNWFEGERSEVLVPGRGATDPYVVWIAEVMLQQTQVSTVWPYFRKWLRTFPTLEILGASSQDEVLKLWEGLGYYSRARNLHKAAKYILEHFDGSLPSTSSQLILIPGIGPYTSAAIASFAFGEVIPLIDGNVLRVISRAEALPSDISKNRTKDEIKALLDTLIPAHNPSAFNQGLMDLGRVVCTPKNPNCAGCILATICQANLAGRTKDFPIKVKKPAIPHYDIVIGLIRRGDQVLIQKRSTQGLLGGLWEFPGGKIERGEQPEAAVLREIKEETGLDVILSEPIGTIKHAYTHFKISLSAWFCDWTTGEAEKHAASENRWISIDEIDHYAFPKANLKIVELLKQ